jgi:hypothetical protein
MRIYGGRVVITVLLFYMFITRNWKYSKYVITKEFNWVYERKPG